MAKSSSDRGLTHLEAGGYLHLPMTTAIRITLGAAATVGLVLVLACGDTLGPPPPNYSNFVDTTSLFAVDGTPVGLASTANSEVVSTKFE